MVKEINMPRIPGWARVPCLLIGIALVIPFFASQIRGSDNDNNEERAQAVAPATKAPASNGEATVYSDTTTDTTDDGMEVSGLLARGPNEHPAVGDRIRIEFSLKNLSGRTVTIDETFIAARNPSGDNVDFGEENDGREFAPREVLHVSRSIILDSEGTWEFWPCYDLRGGGECPDEWRSFDVLVG